MSTVVLEDDKRPWRRQMVNYISDCILLRERDVCLALSLGRSSVRNLMASGALKYLHIGRALRFHRDDVLALAERLRSGEM